MFYGTMVYVVLRNHPYLQKKEQRKGRKDEEKKKTTGIKANAMLISPYSKFALYIERFSEKPISKKVVI